MRGQAVKGGAALMTGGWGGWRGWHSDDRRVGRLEGVAQ